MHFTISTINCIYMQLLGKSYVMLFMPSIYLYIFAVESKLIFFLLSFTSFVQFFLQGDNYHKKKIDFSHSKKKEEFLVKLYLNSLHTSFEQRTTVSCVVVKTYK